LTNSLSICKKAKNSEIRKTPKVFLCDTGLARRLARPDEGRIFENSIFQNLRPKGEIAYYEKKNGAEIYGPRTYSLWIPDLKI
jgi:hypothetical protein